MQAIIFMGGAGGRLGLAAPDGSPIPKSLAELRPGYTMLDYTLEQIWPYVDRISYLLPHYESPLAAPLSNHLKGSPDKKSVIIHDPEPGCGKGKGLAHAISQGAVEVEESLIVHPDDILMPEVYKMIAKRHCAADVELVVAKGVQLPYGVLYRGIFEEKPEVVWPCSTGLARWSVRAVEEAATLTSDHERQLYPKLSYEKRMCGRKIDVNQWLPVNTPKELEVARERFK